MVGSFLQAPVSFVLWPKYHGLGFIGWCCGPTLELDYLWWILVLLKWDFKWTSKSQQKQLRVWQHFRLSLGTQNYTAVYLVSIIAWTVKVSKSLNYPFSDYLWLLIWALLETRRHSCTLQGQTQTRSAHYLWKLTT